MNALLGKTERSFLDLGDYDYLIETLEKAVFYIMTERSFLDLGDYDALSDANIGTLAVIDRKVVPRLRG